MIRYGSIAAALLVSFCLFALGELVLNRRSRNIFTVNESFLVGLSLVSVSLFPLSILLPGRALNSILSLLLLAGCYGLLQLIRNAVFDVGKVRWKTRDPITAFFFALILIVFAQFCYANFRISFLWDGFQIWATKAMVLYDDGALTKKLMVAGVTEQDRINEYPPMVPLFGALVARLQGPFEFNNLKPVFDFFYISLLISTYYAARALLSPRLSMAATAIFSLIPEVSTRYAAGGYADMPQAAVAIAAVAALLHARAGNAWRIPAPWLVGGMIFVKAEGSILAAIACGAVLLYTLLQPRRTALEPFRAQWSSCLLVAVFFLVRRVTIYWLAANDRTYGPIDVAHFQKAWSNLAVVPSICIRYATNALQWGPFWPFFAVAAIIVLVAGNRKERVLALAAIVSLAAYTSIFYFTNWQIALHVDLAYDRLLSQLAPLATLVIAVAFQRLWGTQHRET